MGAAWTDQEREVVREIWKTPVPLALQVHRLPGRTIDAIGREAAKLNIGAKALAVRDDAETLRVATSHVGKRLKQGVALSIDQIHEGSGLGKQRLRFAIKEMIALGNAHIFEYAGPYRTAHFKLGPGVPAIKPPPMTQKEARQRFDQRRRALRAGAAETEEQRAARLDAKYRARDCPWWPKADPVISAAMRSMVELGRRPS